MKNIKNNNRRAFSLVEVMIAISIFTIAMSGFTLLLVNTLGSYKFNMELGQDVLVASQGIGKMEEYIRGAQQGDNGSYPVVSANDNDLVVYVDYDNDGRAERLHFYKSGTDILMGVRESSDTMPRTYASGDAQTLTLAKSVINDASTPVFTYYNQNYPTDIAAITTPAPTSDVRLIKLHLLININPYHVPDNVQLETFVNLRNLNDNIR